MLDPPRKHFELPSVIKTGSRLAPHLGVKRDAQINREKNVSKPFMVWCVCVSYPLTPKRVNECEVKLCVCVCVYVTLNAERVNECEFKMTVCLCVSYPLTLRV